jgi:hypothetical protein
LKSKCLLKLQNNLTINLTNIPEGTLEKKSGKYMSKNIGCNILVVE